MIIRFCYLVVVVLFFSSCGSFMCDRFTSEGFPDNSISRSYIKRRINPTMFGIDTNAVYKDINYKYEESKKQDVPIISKGALNTDLYYRFHQNGTYYKFPKRGEDRTLNSKSFKQKSGNFGFVLSKKDNPYFMSYSTINCGSFSKQEFEMKGDTLIVKHGSNKGNRIWYYYVKQEVPEEWLRFAL